MWGRWCTIGWHGWELLGDSLDLMEAIKEVHGDLPLSAVIRHTQVAYAVYGALEQHAGPMKGHAC